MNIPQFYRFPIPWPRIDAKATISDIGSMKLGIDTFLYQVEGKIVPIRSVPIRWCENCISIWRYGFSAGPIVVLQGLW